MKYDESESELSVQEELPFKNQFALIAWDDYATSTKHNKRFFLEMDKKISNMLGLTKRRVEILEGYNASLRANTAKVVKNKPSTVRTLEFK